MASSLSTLTFVRDLVAGDDGNVFVLGAAETSVSLSAGTDGKSRTENSLVFRLE